MYNRFFDQNFILKNKMEKSQEDDVFLLKLGEFNKWLSIFHHTDALSERFII